MEHKFPPPSYMENGEYFELSPKEFIRILLAFYRLKIKLPRTLKLCSARFHQMLDTT
jgi:hypothetical protein